MDILIEVVISTILSVGVWVIFLFLGRIRFFLHLF